MLLTTVVIAAACSKEPPARTVQEFLDDPILLEAAMVRCSANRQATRYNAECVNAREAVDRIEAREEAERRARAEQQSQAKREALRRAQEAAAEARRRSAEAEQRRKEEAYLAQFGVPMPPDQPEDPDVMAGNTPTALIPESVDAEPLPQSDPSMSATDGGNAPVIAQEPEEEAATDLSAVREELQRRSEDDGS